MAMKAYPPLSQRRAMRLTSASSSPRCGVKRAVVISTLFVFFATAAFDAQSQTVYNDAGISMGVRYYIHNGWCGASTEALVDCETVAANSTFGLPIGAFEFLQGVKVQCFNCANADAASTGCPSGYYEFQCNSTWYYVRQNGDDVTIDEL